MSDQEIIQRTIEIVNEEMAGSGRFKEVRATADEFNVLTGSDGRKHLTILHVLPNHSKAVLDIVSLDRRANIAPVYHFIPLVHGIAALNDRKLRAYQLIKYIESDPREYGGAISRLELPETFEFEGELYGLQIHEVHKQSFILCFSKNPQNRYFWERSTASTPYICLELMPEMRDDEAGRRFYEFRDVYYGEDGSLLLLKRIVDRIKEECNVDSSMSSIPNFAMFAKDPEFILEEEVRFSINGLYTGSAFRIPHYSDEMQTRGIHHILESPYEFLLINLLGLNERPNMMFRSNEDMARFRLNRVLVDEHSAAHIDRIHSAISRYDPVPDIVRYEELILN